MISSTGSGHSFLDGRPDFIGRDWCVESETEAAAGFDLAAAEATSIPAGGKAHAICYLAGTCLNSLLT